MLHGEHLYLLSSSANMLVIDVSDIGTATVVNSGQAIRELAFAGRAVFAATDSALSARRYNALTGAMGTALSSIGVQGASQLSTDGALVSMLNANGDIQVNSWDDDDNALVSSGNSTVIIPVTIGVVTKDVVVNGHLLYVADDNGIGIFDLNDAELPEVPGPKVLSAPRTVVGGAVCRTLQFVPGFLVCIDDTPLGAGGFVVFDVADSGAPFVAGRTKSTESTFIDSLAISGNTVFTLGGGTLTTSSLNDPAVLRAGARTGTRTIDHALAGALVFAGSGPLARIIDVTNPAQARQLNNPNSPAGSVAAADLSIVIASGNSGEAYQVLVPRAFDELVTDTGRVSPGLQVSPVVVTQPSGALTTVGAVSGGLVMIGTSDNTFELWSLSEGTLLGGVVDIEPVAFSAVVDGIVAVSEPDNMQLVDISNPALPVKAGAIADELGSVIASLEIVGAHLVVSGGGVRLFALEDFNGSDGTPEPEFSLNVEAVSFCLAGANIIAGAGPVPSFAPNLRTLSLNPLKVRSSSSVGHSGATSLTLAGTTLITSGQFGLEVSTLAR
ncbi:MAG: hypothetical protein Q8O67_05550 [Deltaproteobacteria bacterium]|nr:hypothetical protein [Deltaproteobacteria bacterium]